MDASYKIVVANALEEVVGAIEISNGGSVIIGDTTLIADILKPLPRILDSI